MEEDTKVMKLAITVKRLYLVTTAVVLVVGSLVIALPRQATAMGGNGEPT